MMKSVLIDLDHTLSDAFHRDHMIGGEGGWDAYHAASQSDAPIEVMCELVKVLHISGHPIIGITARPDKWRQLSLDWLVKHGIPLDELLMRPTTGFEPAPIIKTRLALERFPNLNEQVLLVIDDRDDVCAAFRELGIVCLQVHAGVRQR